MADNIKIVSVATKNGWSIPLTEENIEDGIGIQLGMDGYSILPIDEYLDSEDLEE